MVTYFEERLRFTNVYYTPQPIRHNSADSVPTSNLVCIEDVAIRSTFSHME